MKSKESFQASKVEPRLRSWAQTDGCDERTLILRTTYSADVEQVKADLTAVGARQQSIGPGAVTAVVNPEGLRRLTTKPWVLAAEEPRELFPKS